MLARCQLLRLRVHYTLFVVFGRTGITLEGSLWCQKTPGRRHLLQESQRRGH